MKKLFLLLVAIFTSVFVLVSCGNNAPGGSGSINPGATSSVSQCSHTYGDWVVVKQPTETEKGSAKRTCSLCNNVEVIELPMLAEESYNITETADVRKSSYQLKTNENIVFEVTEHAGEIFCDDCGKDLTTDEFWANMSDSTKYESLVVTAEKFMLKIGPANINLKNANLEVTFDNGIAKRVKGFVTKVDTVENDGQAQDVETTYYFDFEDLVLYTAKKIGEEIDYDKIDFNKKTDGTQLVDEEVVTITTSFLTRDNIVKLLYNIAKVTKDANNNLVVELDWTKIKNINKDLYEKSINQIIKNLTETDLIETATGLIAAASMLKFSDTVTMLDDYIAQIETKLNEYLAKIPQGILPEHLTTLTDLCAYYLVKFGITTEDKVAGKTNLKDLLLAIDPSTETTKVTIGDMVLGKLGVQLPLPDGQTYRDALKNVIKGYLALAFMQSNIDYEAVFKLFEEQIDKVLAYIPFDSTITEVVTLLDMLGMFETIAEVETNVNATLVKLDKFFPIDTTNISNLLKGLLVNAGKITEAQAAGVTSLKDVILLFDKSSDTDPYMLDELVVDLFGIKLNEGETPSQGITRIVTTFLNKTVYDLIIDTGIIQKLFKYEATKDDLFVLVDGLGLTFAQTALVPKVVFAADGVIKEASLKLDGFGYIDFQCVIKTNAHIEMIDIRVE